MDFIIRPIEVTDTQNLLDYIETISGESKNVTFGPGEFNMTFEDEKKFIEKIEASDNQIMLIAEINNEIIGQLHYSGGGRNRTRHIGEFGITVKKKYWGNGIGKALMEAMIDWAKTSKYCEKINLRVRDDNYNAITLYRKMGFQVEGRISRDMKIDGVFVDALFMGLKIDK